MDNFQFSEEITEQDRPVTLTPATRLALTNIGPYVIFRCIDKGADYIIHHGQLWALGDGKATRCKRDEFDYHREDTEWSLHGALVRR